MIAKFCECDLICLRVCQHVYARACENAYYKSDNYNSDDDKDKQMVLVRITKIEMETAVIMVTKQ